MNQKILSWLHSITLLTLAIFSAFQVGINAYQLSTNQAAIRNTDLLMEANRLHLEKIAKLEKRISAMERNAFPLTVEVDWDEKKLYLKSN